MAHLTFHLAEGLALGTALTLLPVVRAWGAGRPVARPLLTMALASFVAAGVAALPPVKHAQNAIWPYHRGLLVGEFAIAAWLVGFYLLTLLAIRRTTGRPAAGTQADSRTPDR